LLKLRQEQYQSDKNVDLREQTVTFNVSPLQFTRKKPKYINPYILFGFDNNIISLYGDPLPVTSLNGGNNNNGNIGQDHCCCLPEDNFPDEDMDQSSLQEEIMNPGSGKNHVGDLKVLRTDIGAGVMLNISSKKLFTKLFAEAKYGTQSTSRTATQGLKNTWASDQITISFGVVVGLNLAGLSRY
ncbi:MAG TPA: hypothetical protein PKC24_01840, partial [Cyclobacteriaceae bacterium]|nr:hypothetical protein [Cyclobacteriaceae bacterium]